jgi:hypothetical protein
MSRRWYTLTALALAALGQVGCNELACGPGTKQIQDTEGHLRCVNADAPATGDVPCDVDGGTAMIVDGVCVSRVVCDPATAQYDPATGLCTGNGMMMSGCPLCPMSPGAGMTCLSGRVIDFSTGMPLAMGARTVRVAAYDPLTFLSNPSAAPITSTTDDHACFTFTIATPATGIVALSVDDPSGATPKLALAATGAPVVANTSYKVDAYLLAQSFVDGWAQVDPTYTSAGTYVGCFYKDPPPSPLDLRFTETMPASGVQLYQNGTLPSPVSYLKADRSVDTALNATGALGCAITRGTGNAGQITGKGGGVAKWETQLGGSTAATVFISRLHDCDGTTGNAFCQ